LTAVFPLLDWSTVGREIVLAIHDAGLLQIQQENDIMVEFLKRYETVKDSVQVWSITTITIAVGRDASEGTASKAEDLVVECRLFLVNQSEGPRSVSRIILRTLDSYKARLCLRSIYSVHCTQYHD
jgi:hypothetical protein